MDLSKTIIPKSDQLNADDLVGGSKTITIRKVSQGADDTQPVNIYYFGDDNKPYKPCKSMRRLLVQLWGVDGAQFVGRSLTIFRDDSVMFAGVEVGGIRISHVSDIQQPTKVLITTAKSKRRPVTVEPLKQTKKAITDFAKALESVKSGEITAVRIIETYDLTNEQIVELANLVK
jgi:hypothetical protein